MRIEIKENEIEERKRKGKKKERRRKRKKEGKNGTGEEETRTIFIAHIVHPSPTPPQSNIVDVDERIPFGVPRRVLCVRMREWEIVVEVDWPLIVNPGSFSFFYGIIKTLCLLCHARKRGKERTSRVLITIKYVLSAYYFVYFITVTSLLMLLPLSSMIFFPFVIIINIIIIIIIEHPSVCT